MAIADMTQLILVLIDHNERVDSEALRLAHEYGQRDRADGHYARDAVAALASTIVDELLACGDVPALHPSPHDSREWTRADEWRWSVATAIVRASVDRLREAALSYEWDMEPEEWDAFLVFDEDHVRDSDEMRCVETCEMRVREADYCAVIRAFRSRARNTWFTHLGDWKDVVEEHGLPWFWL